MRLPLTPTSTFTLYLLSLLFNFPTPRLQNSVFRKERIDWKTRPKSQIAADFSFDHCTINERSHLINTSRAKILQGFDRKSNCKGFEGWKLETL